jgi:hypothetical protein
MPGAVNNEKQPKKAEGSRDSLIVFRKSFIYNLNAFFVLLFAENRHP